AAPAQERASPPVEARDRSPPPAASLGSGSAAPPDRPVPAGSLPPVGPPGGVAPARPPRWCRRLPPLRRCQPRRRLPAAPPARAVGGSHGQAPRTGRG